MQDNPYETPGTTHSVSARIALTAKTMFWWLIYLYPVIAISAVYACWGLTAVDLGRPPGFGEHPENDAMHTLVHLLGNTTAISLLAGPMLVLLGAFWSVTQPFARRPSGVTTVSRIVCLTTYVLMLVAVVSIWSHDPYGAIYWFRD